MSRFTGFIAVAIVACGTTAQSAFVFIGEDNQASGISAHRWTIADQNDNTGSDHVEFFHGAGRPSGFVVNSTVSPDELYMGIIVPQDPPIVRSTNAFSAAPTIDGSRNIPASVGPPVDGTNGIGGIIGTIASAPGGDIYAHGTQIGFGKSLARLTPTATGATVDYFIEGNNGARGMTVSPWGEIFVAGDPNTIYRYIDNGTTFTPNGTIADINVNNPHGVVFRGNELFVANFSQNSIVRLAFDVAGTAGVVNDSSVFGGNGLNRPSGLAVAPWGELWVTNLNVHNAVSRFAFDGGDGSAVSPNGIFEFDPLPTPVQNGSFGIAFFTAGAALAGDLNGDGFVGQDDLNIVLGDWGNMPPGDPRADPSGDGFVGQDDLNPVLADWGQGTPPLTLAGSSLSAAAVPEPQSVALLILGIAGCLFFYRRRP